MGRRYAFVFSRGHVHLILVCRLLAYWAVPTLVVVLLHENCIGAWRLLWSICRETHPHHNRFDARLYYFNVLSTAELCQLPDAWAWLSNRKCGHAIISILGDMLFQKLLVEAFVVPTCFMWLMHFAKLAKDGNLRLNIFRVSFDVAGKLSESSQTVHLLTWLEISVTWGPLAPLLQLLLLVALTTNAVMYQVGTQCFKGSPTESDGNTQRSEAECLDTICRIIAIGFCVTLAMFLNMRVWIAHLLCVVPVFFLRSGG